MASGLIVANDSNAVLLEVQTGLLDAIEQASDANAAGKNSLGLAALAKELRKYEKLLDQQPQASSVTTGKATLTKVENTLRKAFKQALDSNAAGNKSLELAALAKELRKYEKELTKKNVPYPTMTAVPPPCAI